MQGLVEAHPERRERRAPDHRRPDRHLRLLRSAVECVPDGEQHRQPLRPGDVHHPPRNGRALRPDPERDRPLRRLRRRCRRLHRHGPHRRPPELGLVGRDHRRDDRLSAHRCLPRDHHHQAEDPVLRRDPGRAPGLAGRPDLRLRRRQGCRRRRDHGLEQRHRRPGQRHHEPRGGVDPPHRPGRSLRPRRGVPHGTAARPRADGASAEHHAPHRRRRRGRRRRAGVRLQPEPRQPVPGAKASPG